ncbi:MAG: hypothetical protein AAGJ35_06280, partial [Myxococcota bacterium]
WRWMLERRWWSETRISWFYVCCVGMLCLGGWLFCGCEKSNQTSKLRGALQGEGGKRAHQADGGVVTDRKGRLETLSRKRPTTRAVQKDVLSWMKGSWVEHILRDRKVLRTFLGKSQRGTPLFEAMRALRMGGQAPLFLGAVPVKSAARMKASDATSLNILWLRGHFTLGRAYRQLAQMTWDLQDRVFAQRWSMREQLNRGHKLPFYWGRVLCLQGRDKEAQKMFMNAARIGTRVSGIPKRRIRAWQRLCALRARPSSTKKQRARAFRKQRFFRSRTWRMQVDGVLWSVLLKLPLPKKVLKPEAERVRAWLRPKLELPLQTSWAAEPMDTEKIMERGVAATLEYHDVALSYLLSMAHFKRVEALLQRVVLQKGQKQLSIPYVGFVRAQLSWNNDRWSEAETWLRRYQEAPASSSSLSMLLFSDILHPQQMSVLVDWQQTRLQEKEVDRIWERWAQKRSCAERLWALGVEKASSAVWRVANLGSCAAWLEQMEQALRGKTNASSKKDVGLLSTQVALFRMLRLRLFVLRPMVQTFAHWALRNGKRELAVRWLERIHQKNPSYVTGQGNQPEQMLQTAMAYLSFGRWATASQFLLRNRALLPLSEQSFRLLGWLRLARGMRAGRTVKSGD